MGGFHARTLVGSASVNVVAVVDQDRAASAAVAAEIGATSPATLDDLLARSDVEAWLVATPTLTHGDVVRAAIGSGIHVLCEKPLSLDTAESAALGSAAADAGLILQIGFWRRFAPPWVMARELLRDGAIGRPLLLRLAQWDADPPPPTFCDPAVSGGLAIDCGVHEYDLAEWLTGLRIERVTAHGLPLVDETIGAVGDVDNLLAVLELTDGAVATVELTRNCRYGDDVRTEILGAEGAIFIDLLPRGRTRLATATGSRVVPGSETGDAFAAGVARQADSFAAAVRTGAGAVPLAAASTRALEIGRAVQRAAATGAAVTASG
jgi:myo-inositol 2-dehydrogenase/D-chiro-inositol 1-dehydrogenase